MSRLVFVYLVYSRTPWSSTFPYTTLFRSPGLDACECQQRARLAIRIVRELLRRSAGIGDRGRNVVWNPIRGVSRDRPQTTLRSEEHTSELQSRVDLVCRLLLEKKK